MSKKQKKAVVSSPKVNITDCERKSLFSAHKAGETEKSLKTWIPSGLFGFVSFFVGIYHKEYAAIAGDTVKAILDLLENSEKIVDFLETYLGLDMGVAGATVNYTASAISFYLIFTAIMGVIQFVVKKLENERIRKAANTYYYFYKDMLEIVDQNKGQRVAIRTLNGIVSYKVDAPVKSKRVRDKFMAALVSVLRRDSREYWKYKHEFADVIITTTGNLGESIVLRDVAEPDVLIANIKKHYHTATNLSVGNSFNI